MQNLRDYLLIACLGALLFFPFLGQSHLFDWDEINFAEASREMVVTGNYTQTQIDFRQFWEKPPFFFWLQAGSMHLFGINEYAARFPNAVCGILTLMLLFAIGTFHYDRRMGWWWVLCYAGSILPQFYFKSGIIDPWFNLFIFLGIYGFIRYIEQYRSLKWLVISALGAGLSVLTKGPVGVALVGLTVGIYYITTRFRQFPP
ncbi:MAG TPA: glycosyltransferase family 39 protein, partial [Chitinophagales bacterium]|nr:glycosyltransferase family 39 protein [Chitinophagales bacterium]